MKITADNFPTSGNISYEIPGDKGDVYGLDINPAFKVLRLHCPDGSVHVSDTRNENWRSNVVPSLVPPSTEEIIQKFFRETEFYFNEYFGPLFYEADEDDEKEVISSEPFNLEYFGEEGKYS